LEETVKSIFLPCVVALAACAPSLAAQAAPPYASGTVVGVQKRDSYAPYVGSNPSDAPVSSDVYAYDVSVRIHCTTYVGHYESAVDYLPSALAADHQIDVSVRKHMMYLKVPGYGDLKMAIVSRRTSETTVCGDAKKPTARSVAGRAPVAMAQQ
jgi:hypothetical protein